MPERLTLLEIDEAVARLMEPKPKRLPKSGEYATPGGWWAASDGFTLEEWMVAKHPTTDGSAALEVAGGFYSVVFMNGTAHVIVFTNGTSGKATFPETTVAICLAYLAAHGREVEVADG